jgi:chemotaxis protein histidine kinase CheA
MNCQKCNNTNKADSKFCRSCGTKLSRPNTKLTITLPSFSLPNLSGLLSVIRRQNKKVILVSALVILLGAGTAFAAPKVNDFIKINGFIKEALRKESAGEYQGALDTLALTDNRWTTESKRQEVVRLKESQSKYIQFKTSFDSSLEKEKQGKLVEAREQLQSIGTEYPQYESVREKLNALQVSIEGDLQEKARLKEVEAQKANAAAAASRQQAAADSAARTRAEAEKAASDAQSRAAAQSARDAEVRKQQAEAQAQQEAAQRAEEVRKSFKNQLITGYSSYSSGVSYYGSAISYSNSGSSLLALSQANSARAVLNSARNSVSDLNSRFTGLPSDYYTAASNMVTAIDYLNSAIDLLVQSEGTSLDYSSSINSNKNLAVIYAARVKSFLDSN